MHVITAEAKQLEKMQAKLIQVLLPAMGYNRHMPTAIRHGPMELCGIGLLDLRTLIGSTKVQHILQQLRLPRVTGLMLIIYLNWLQIIAGTSIPILDDARQLPHITDRWIKTVQDFLNKTNSSILIQDLVILQPRREQDIHIMDQIIDSHIWSARETRTLNNWRLYLRIETIADMTDSLGINILPEYWKPKRTTRYSRSTHLWPRQRKPTTHANTLLWRRFLKSITNTNDKLKTPLGKWTNTEDRLWSCTYSASEQVVLIEHRQQWQIYHIREKNRRQWKLEPSMQEITTDIQEYGKLTPATYSPRHHSIQPPMDHKQNLHRTPIPILTFQQYIDNLPLWEKDLLQRHRECTEHTKLPSLSILLFQDNTLDISSDGGAIPPYRGSYGWTISVEELILWEGQGYARGYPMDSDRSEPYGRLSAMLFLYHYAKFMGCHQSPVKIRFFCDNENVVNHDSSDKDPWYSPSTTMSPNWDIYTQLHITKKEFIKIFPNTTACQHVRGHQDQSKPIHTLHWTAQLNCRCDTLASEILQKYDPKQQEIMYPLPSCPAYLLCNKTYITSKSIKHIEDLTNEHAMYDYYKERFSWTESTFQSINWEAIKTTRRFKTTSKNFTTKLCCKWLPTLKQLHRNKERNDPTCITCGEIETQAHIFQCHTRSKWKCTFVTNLREFFNKYDTSPVVENAILDGSTTWLDNKPNHNTTDPQAKIGWEAFHYGFIAREWQTMQELHYQQNKNNRENTTTSKPHIIPTFDMHFPTPENTDQTPNPSDQQPKEDGKQKKKKKIVKTGPVWASKLIELIWLNMRSAWDIRNKILHDKETTESQERYREEIEKKVEFLYSQKHLLSAADRHYFYPSLAERLLQSTQEIEHWYDNNVQVIMYCIKEQQERETKGNRDIRTYFHPKPTTNTPTPSPPQIHSMPSTSTTTDTHESQPISKVSITNTTTTNQNLDTPRSRSTDPITTTPPRQRETSPNTTNTPMSTATTNTMTSQLNHISHNSNLDTISPQSTFSSDSSTTTDQDSNYSPSTCESLATTTKPLPRQTLSRHVKSIAFPMRLACGKSALPSPSLSKKPTAKKPFAATPRFSKLTTRLPKLPKITGKCSPKTLRTSTKHNSSSTGNKPISCNKQNRHAKYSGNRKRKSVNSENSNNYSLTNPMKKTKPSLTPEVHNLTPQTLTLQQKRKAALQLLNTHKKMKQDLSTVFSPLDLFTDLG
jgi:hypothetical protein